MITAVTTCMGRLDHLETTLPLMLEDFEHVIVVDWSCPQNSGDWAEKQGAEVVRVYDQRYFHMARSRNIGATRVKTRSVCFIDADTMIMGGVRTEVSRLLNLSTMVVAARTSQNADISSLVGFLAVDIGQFWGVGGYNENLEGYGLEDCYLRAQLRLERGMGVKRVSPGALGSIRHDNTLRGKFFKEPIEVSGRRNHHILTQYLKSQGVSDWVTDPKTEDIAYRLP